MDGPFWRWYTGSRAIGLRNNVVYSLMLHHIMKNSGLAVAAKQDLDRMDDMDDLPTTRSPAFTLNAMRRVPRHVNLWLTDRVLLNLFLVPIYFSFLVLLYLLAYLSTAIEFAMVALSPIYTCGAVLLLDFGAAPETFVVSLEWLFGRLFRHSYVSIHTRRAACDCEHGFDVCRDEVCFTVERSHILWIRLGINCSCFRRHYDKCVQLAGDSGDFDTCFDDGDSISDLCFMPGFSCVLRDLASRGCGCVDATLFRERYDFKRVMWHSVVIKTVDSSAAGNETVDEKFDKQHVEFRTSEKGNEDTIIVYLNKSHMQLGSLQHYKYSFWRDAFCNGTDEQLEISHIRIIKFVTSIALIASQLFVVHSGDNSVGNVYRSALTLSVVLGGVFALPHRVDFAKLGGMNGPVGRMLGILAVSAGQRTTSFRALDSSWSVNEFVGDTPLGRVSYFENLVLNLSVAVQARVRQGTTANGVQLQSVSRDVESGDGDMRKFIIGFCRIGWALAVGRLEEVQDGRAGRRLKVKEWGIIPVKRKRDVLESFSGCTLIDADVV